MSRTGMSLKDPQNGEGLFWSLFVGRPCGWLCLVIEGFSHGLVLEPSLKGPGVQIRRDSGESASSLARERLLCMEQRSVSGWYILQNMIVIPVRIQSVQQL